MSEHKYHVGQAVEFFPQRGVEHTAKGRFKVVRILLGERNAPHYRIKHEVDGHERMVGESELRPTVIRRLRTGRPKADRAHPAPLAWQIAQKSRCQTVFASNGLLERAIMSRVFPSRGPPAGTAVPGHAPILRKGTAWR